MKVLVRFATAIASALRVIALVAAVIAVLWGIVYRLFLGFTPPWLDVATMVSAGIGLLVLWAFTKNDTFNYKTGKWDSESKKTN